jgi:beta-lactamase regulating signal transducer with metallopeptidase domain/multidrug resistance efflux pump
MNDMAMGILIALGRTTLLLAAAGVATSLVLRLARPQWPIAHRAAWLAVLVVGWTFLRVPLEVAVYEAPRVEPARNVAVVPLERARVDLSTQLRAPAIELAASTEPAAQATLPIVSATERELVESKPEPWAVDWRLAIVAAWLGGIVVLVAVWMVGYARFVRALASRQPGEDPWQAEWRDLVAAHGVRRDIPLAVTAQFGPVLCRLPRGYELIVPGGLWSELDATARQAVLRHELAHYQRGDVWKSLAARLLALPHWFNPIAWLAVRRFDDAAEWACDRAATADAPATELAKVLVRLGQSPATFGYGSAARGRTLAARIRRLLAGAPKEDSNMKKTVLLALGVLLVALSAVQLNLVAREPAAADAKSEDRATEPTEPREAAPVADASGENSKEHATRFEVAAPADGEIVEVLVKHGQTVKKGDVVVRMRNSYLEATMLELTRKLSTTQSQIATIRPLATNRRLSEGELKTLAQQEKSLQEQLALLQEDIKSLMVRSPIDGQVATRMVFELLIHRPVRKGQVLLAIEGPADQRTASPAGTMLEQAKRAYETHLAAFKAQTITMPPVYDWSLRWAQAAQEAAPTPAEKISAAKDHVERMRSLQQGVEALYKIGSRGGEAADYAAANFYLAEAERELARAEADAAPAAPSTGSTRADPTQLIDLKIKLAELKGQMEQAKIQLEASASAEEYAKAAYAAAKITPAELARAIAERRKLESELVTASEQLKLYEQKLKLIESPSKPPATAANVGVDNAVEFLRSRATLPDGSDAKTKLRYAGKTFDQWAEELRTDLSPTTRAEAVTAIATFGAHGLGPQAAAAIIDAMKDYSVWIIDGMAAGHLKAAALEAFNVIPAKDSVPLLIEALKSENANQRLLAATVLWNVPDKKERARLLTPLLKDPAAEVRYTAAGQLLTLAPGTPGLVEILREALTSQEPAMKVWALGTMHQGYHLSLAPLAPELVGMLAGESFDSRVADLIEKMGNAAVPALEAALKSDQRNVRERSDYFLKRIRGQAEVPPGGRAPLKEKGEKPDEPK